MAATAGLVARQRRLERLAIVARAGMGVAPARMVQVLAEGVTLANFEGASRKSAPDASWLTAVRSAPPEAPDLAAALTRGVTMGECSNVARICQRARQPPDAASIRRAGGAWPTAPA